jgi:hypothetical protein
MGGGYHGRFVRSISVPDFYVGPNKQVLPAKYRHWIGVSKREVFLKKAKNSRLRNAINQLFRPGSFIGDGGTASVLIFEKRTGEHVSRNPQGHYIKAKNMIEYMKNKVLKENLTNGDRKLAKSIIKHLYRAVLEWED